MIPSPAVSNMFHSLLTLWCALAPNTHTHTRARAHTPHEAFLPEFLRVLAAHTTYSHITHVNTHIICRHSSWRSSYQPPDRSSHICCCLPKPPSHTGACVQFVCVCVSVRVCARAGVCLRTRHARPLNAYFSFPLPHSNT
jgi:hypothetical protein